MAYPFFILLKFRAQLICFSFVLDVLETKKRNVGDLVGDEGTKGDEGNEDNEETISQEHKHVVVVAVSP